MVEGVVVLDSQQRVVFANEAARPLLDFQSPDVLNRPLWEVARLVPVNRLVERVLASGQRTSDEFEIPRTKRSVAVTADALPREPMPGAMLVLHDVTELRRLERMRRDFVSNVSHELKTPLTSIQAYADTLLEGGFDDVEKDRHFLQKIVEQSERLAELILDIIRLGKIESDPNVFDIRPVRLAPVIGACVDAHATVAKASDVALQSEAIDDDVAVMADANELRTILDNLVDNALNYTPESGRITVRAIHGEGGLVGIEVADTGIGIPKEQQSRIFERFYRVDRARDRQQGGTGLGLSIVKHLCHLFGGRVDVESELGVGTHFTVWLQEADSGVEALGTASAEPSRNLNIGSLTS
jgi:two-component system phosphate regulon sensor histidine kinase PhoR